MTSERIEEFSKTTVVRNRPMSEDGDHSETTLTSAGRDDTPRQETREARVTKDATDPKDPQVPKDAKSTAGDNTAPSENKANQQQPGKQPDKPKEPPKALSEAKVRAKNHLPAMEDDKDVGIEKEHIVTRDGKADLLFLGVLLASAAPDAAPKNEWQELRIYQTNGGKHVFSRVTRTIYQEDEDHSEADLFDPSPSSVPSQLFRSAREMARSRPFTWMDAAVAFFGYDPLAKVLYRKLDVRFEEQIT